MPARVPSFPAARAVTQEEVVGKVIDALERLGVVYMVAGSFSSKFHGIPRMTRDLLDDARRGLVS